jgi:hypothetical protein
LIRPSTCSFPYNYESVEFKSIVDMATTKLELISHSSIVMMKIYRIYLYRIAKKRTKVSPGASPGSRGSGRRHPRTGAKVNSGPIFVILARAQSGTILSLIEGEPADCFVPRRSPRQANNLPWERTVQLCSRLNQHANMHQLQHASQESLHHLQQS